MFSLCYYSIPVNDLCHRAGISARADCFKQYTLSVTMAKRKLFNFFEDNKLDNCSSDSDSFDKSDFEEHQSLLNGYNTDTELEISDGSETETTTYYRSRKSGSGAEIF